MSSEKIIVNHVMSRSIESGIFDAILGYFKKYSPTNIEHIETIRPLESANIYHYHRPHLEEKLLPTSVCTVHHDLGDPDPWHSREHFIPRYLESSAIICLNQTQRSILVSKEGIDENVVHVIPHGYNEEVLKSYDKTNKEKFVIGVISKRYGRRVKGEAYLFELVKRLNPSSVKFILVGEGRGYDAVQFRKWGFEVDVFNRLPYSVFGGVYKEIDALLMCSSYEGGPANIPEALATATPIFSTPIGMSLDLIENNKNGIFLTRDPNKDSHLIMDIVSDKSKYEALRANCIEKRGEVLTWRDCILKNIDVYLRYIRKKQDINRRNVSL